MSLAHSDANTSVSALSTKSLHATDSVISTHFDERASRGAHRFCRLIVTTSFAQTTPSIS